ncbi:Uncharacterised protein [Mycobacterium tuberculosis]|nr:Uncharacterised protein [Mycobacterium tuberculosis]
MIIFQYISSLPIRHLTERHPLQITRFQWRSSSHAGESGTVIVRQATKVSKLMYDSHAIDLRLPALLRRFLTVSYSGLNPVT